MTAFRKAGSMKMRTIHRRPTWARPQGRRWSAYTLMTYPSQGTAHKPKPWKAAWLISKVLISVGLSLGLVAMIYVIASLF
jgi:hypothetical protein